MLYGKILRSPHAHAIIENIDYSKAIEHPEFKALVTHKDLLITQSSHKTNNSTQVSTKLLDEIKEINSAVV